jgi:hypothetical protein
MVICADPLYEAGAAETKVPSAKHPLYPSIAADDGVEDGAGDEDLVLELVPEVIEEEEADETGLDVVEVVAEPDDEILTPRAQLPPQILVLSPVQLAVHLSSPSRRASGLSVWAQ